MILPNWKKQPIDIILIPILMTFLKKVDKLNETD